MIFSKLTTSLLLPSLFLTALAFPQHHSPPMTEPKMRGVNLGGWLLTEPWITPSIYDRAAEIFPAEPPVDEWTLCKKYGKARCLEVLRDHWETFVTEDDFRQIRDAGLTHVRIPIGYWAIHPKPEEPFVTGSLLYLERALQWAQAHGLEVWLDLHGAPGSQNGFDNSGRKVTKAWLDSDSNVQWTLETIRKFADSFVRSNRWPALTGFCILNEPFYDPLDHFVRPIINFSKDAYGIVRSASPSINIVISDSGWGSDVWGDAITETQGYSTVQDKHKYFVFGPSLGDFVRFIDGANQVREACQAYGGMTSARAGRKVVVGEWSGASTDCAKYLIEKPVMGKHFQTGQLQHGECSDRFQGSVLSLPPAKQEDMRKFIEAQLHSWNKVDGWFFWTWKTEGAPEWDLRGLINAGLFPRGPSDLRYPNICAGLE